MQHHADIFLHFYNIQPRPSSFIQEKYTSKDRLSIMERLVRYIHPILEQSERYECSCWCWLRSPFTRVVFCWVYNGNKSLYPYLAIHHQIGDTQDQTFLGNPDNARVGIPPGGDSVWYPSCRQELMQSLQERCLADKFDCVSFVVITPLMILLGRNGHECYIRNREIIWTSPPGLCGSSYNLFILRGSQAKFESTTWFYLRALSVTDILYLLFMIGYLVKEILTDDW